MLVMLNTLMDISEAESGAMPLQREPVDLREVAARAVELYRDVAEAKGVTLTTGDRPVKRWSYGDRVRLEQVAANLIDNAVKYTPPGGRVVVGVAVARAARALLRVTRHGRRHSGGRTAAHLGPVVPRRSQPHRAGARPGPEPGEGAIVEAHGGVCARDKRAGSGCSVHGRAPRARDRVSARRRALTDPALRTALFLSPM